MVYQRSNIWISASGVLVLLLGLAQLPAEHAWAQNVRSTGHFDSAETVGPTGQIISLSLLGKTAVGLEVREVERRMLPLELSTPGKIEPIPTREFAQHSPVSGRVSEVMVNLGDAVHAGQILLQLVSPELNKVAGQILQEKQNIESQIAEQRTVLDDEVNECNARIQLAQENYSRDTKLFDEKIGSQKQMQTSLAALDVAKAQAKAAVSKRDIVLQGLRNRLTLVMQPLRQQLEMLGASESTIDNMISKGKSLTIAPVRSVRSGVITSINASAGQGIDPSVKLFTVSDLSKVWATAQIYEDDMSRIKIGQKVMVRVPSFTNKNFWGVLSYIGDRVDVHTRTLPVRAMIDNSDLKLKPDMYADLIIQIDDPAVAVLLPQEAVVERTGHNLAFVEVKGGFQPTRVEVGRSFGDLLEITGGLKPGQRVVVHGAFQLAAEMLRTSGNTDQFQQATEGDHEKSEVAAEQSKVSYTNQFILVAIAIAFILGFIISTIAARVRRSPGAEQQRQAPSRRTVRSTESDDEFNRSSESPPESSVTQPGREKL